MNEATETILCNVVNIVSFLITIFSLLSSVVALFFLVFYKPAPQQKANNYHKANMAAFNSLTSACIIFIIITDIIFSLIQLPNNVLYILYDAYYPVQRKLGKSWLRHFLMLFNELSEGVFMISNCFSFFAALSMYFTIHRMHLITLTMNNSRAEEWKDEDLKALHRNQRWTIARNLLLFCILAIGIPSFVFGPVLFATMWADVKSSKTTRIIVQITSDFVKTIFYIVLETGMMILRILTYKLISTIFGSVASSVINSPNTRKKRKEQSKLRAQLYLYSLPLWITCAWLVVYRVSYNVDLARRVFGTTGELSLQYTDYEKVFLAMNRCIVPLRGILDAIVYCFVSRWFIKKSYEKLCCCVRQSPQEPETKPIIRQTHASARNANSELDVSMDSND